MASTLMPPRTGSVRRPGHVLSEAWTLTRREMIHLRREPGALLGEVLFAAVFVLLFGFVFGSAINVPGGDYLGYLMPGLLAMIVPCWGVMISAQAVSEDRERGVMDRLRSMPISSAAVPLGRTLADIIKAVPGLIVMALIGVLAGWRPAADFPSLVLGLALILLMGYAFRWIGTMIGFLFPPGVSFRIAQLGMFAGFMSNAFVPTSGMASWLRTIIEWNPISALIAATRTLFATPTAEATSLPMQHPVTATIIWALVLLAICIPVTLLQRARREV